MAQYKPTSDDIDEIEEQDDLVEALFAYATETAPADVACSLRRKIEYFFGLRL